MFSRVSGRQRSSGFEAEAHWAPRPGLTADLAYSYIRGRYLEDELVPRDTDLPKNGPWLAQANVGNLLDELYYPDACCLTRITPGQPRNFRLTLSRRF